MPGVTAHGLHAGLKYKDPDLALVVSEVPCTAAGTFTTNGFAAPPVHVTRAKLDGPVRAIVCNSAVANACTGEQGYQDAHAMAETAADALGLSPSEVLVASTGVIGRPLPMDEITEGIHAAANALVAPQAQAQAPTPATGATGATAGSTAQPGPPPGGDALAAAEAITTTDTHAKHVAATVDAGERSFTVGAIAKGSGMIHPTMATMLCFAATDAPVEREHLQPLVSDLVEDTFNMITVDGDESTNDMALVLANGHAGGPSLEPGTPAFAALEEALASVFDEMARQIAGDGEGATSLFEVTVAGAETRQDARLGARAIAGSSLVKAALHGQDPNWGRIVAALGATDARVEPDRVSLSLHGDGADAVLLEQGTPAADGALDDAEAALAADEVTALVELGLGPYQATAYGCDLSEEYVTINADYTT